MVVSPDGKSVYATSQTPNAVVRFYRDTTTGWIAQPTGTAGCVSETGAGACANGHALTNPGAPTVSPDGKSLYVTSDDAVVRFNRNPTTGAITQPPGTAGCVSNTGAGPCVDGHALNGPTGVAVSPDGKSVYAAVPSSTAVARFNRAP